MRALFPSLLLLTLLVSELPAQAQYWDPAAGGNGHWYEAVHTGPITWTDAELQASADRGSHLASIASTAENDLCFGLVNQPQFWTVNVYNCAIGPWLGGYQTDKNSEPAGAWAWSDGTPWSFTYWFPGEPNNSGGTEDVMHFFNCYANTAERYWNDLTDVIQVDVHGYVREWEFALQDPSPGTAGTTNLLYVEGAPPGARVHFGGSVAAGNQAVPGCPGLFAGLRQPQVLGSAAANADGHASISIAVPSALAGRTGYLQAGILADCRLTGVVAYAFN